MNKGFTLLEVMVAVLILGISLASIFSSQAGAIAINNHIKYTTIAGELAKCRMSEIELEIYQEGFEEAAFADWEDGTCCELRDEIERNNKDPFSCKWKIESVKLPSLEEVQTAAGEAVTKQTTDTQTTQDAMAMGSGLMSGILPIVQQLLEQAIRKVTVQVNWTERDRERSFEIIQYLTNPAQGDLGSLLQSTTQEESNESQTESSGQQGAGGSTKTSSQSTKTGRGGVEVRLNPGGGTP